MFIKLLPCKNNYKKLYIQNVKKIRQYIPLGFCIAIYIIVYLEQRFEKRLDVDNNYAINMTEEEVEQKIINLARNSTNLLLYNITSPSVKIFLQFLQQDNVTFGSAVDKLQSLEMAIRRFKRLKTGFGNNVNEETYFKKLGFTVKNINGTLQLLINGKWWEVPVYNGPYYHKPPTDAPISWTGIYDLKLERWVVFNGKKTKYSSLGYWQKIIRSRAPWCVLTDSQKWTLRWQVYVFLAFGNSNDRWYNDIYGNKRDRESLLKIISQCTTC